MTRYRRDLDNQGCCNAWQHGIRTIDGQYPDDNRDFNLQAGDGIEITPVTAGVEISVKAPLPGPMVFRGTVGTGGTVASLPDANVDNIGWAYVAVSAGTTPDDTPKSYAVGDMLVSDGAEWVVIPAGDDPVAWSQITGKPTTLSGYGITDAVTLNTTQDVNSFKTFLQNVKLKNDIAYSSGSQYAKALEFNTDSSGNRVGAVTAVRRDTNMADVYMEIRDPADGTSVRGSLRLQTDGATSTYMTGPTRTYNSANINDIVTIGSLASNPTVVHTLGNESIFGDKKFNGYILVGDYARVYPYTDNNGKRLFLSAINTNNVEGRLEIRMNEDGSVALYLRRFDSGTFTDVTIATIPA